MKLFSFLLFGLNVSVHLNCEPKTVQATLTYSRETKLLVIHLDDIGVPHSQNDASFKTMQTGAVNSGSIMVPCPWFAEVVTYIKKGTQMQILACT